MTNIPAKMSLVNKSYQGIYDKLARLAIGEYAEYPFKKRSTVYDVAKKVGIRVTARQIGSGEIVRFYRVK